MLNSLQFSVVVQLGNSVNSLMRRSCGCPILHCHGVACRCHLNVVWLCWHLFNAAFLHSVLALRLFISRRLSAFCTIVLTAVLGLAAAQFNDDRHEYIFFVTCLIMILIVTFYKGRFTVIRINKSNRVFQRMNGIVFFPRAFYCLSPCVQLSNSDVWNLAGMQ